MSIINKLKKELIKERIREEMNSMKKHFVVYLSPGTLVSESSEREIDSWDVDKALTMVREIKERHSATPYGFYFITRSRGPEDLDSKITESSHMYFLGGRVMTLEDVKIEMPKEKILIHNMENNGYHKIIVNDNSWRITLPLNEEDVILPFIKEL